MMKTATARGGVSRTIPMAGQSGYAPLTSRIITTDPTQKRIEAIKARALNGQATSKDVFKLRSTLDRLPSEPVGKKAAVFENALKTLVLIASTSEDGVIRSQALNGV